MLDINFIRDNFELVKKGAEAKNVKVDLETILALDQKRRALIQEVDQLRATKNASNQKIVQLQGDEKQTAIQEMKQISEQEKKKSEELTQIETDWQELMLQIPNPPSSTTPIGKD